MTSDVYVYFTLLFYNAIYTLPWFCGICKWRVGEFISVCFQLNSTNSPEASAWMGCDEMRITN